MWNKSTFDSNLTSDKTIPVVLHGYSWKGGIFTKPASVTPVNTPPKIAEKNKSTEVPPEAKLTINFNHPPQFSVYLRNRSTISASAYAAMIETRVNWGKP